MGQRFYCVILICASLEIYAFDHNTIVVRGYQAEKQDKRGAVHSTHTRPSEASRFDLDSQYRDQASVLTAKSGDIKASGFNIPRIRGQDIRVTEVFVNDLLISSPYTSMTLVDQLDVRAFDEVALHQGVSELGLATANPIGALQLLHAPIRKSNYALGLDFGKPFGASYWGLIKEQKHQDGVGVHARLYVREHQTDGKYQYYSDEGTPYNKTDDRMVTREDNRARSQNLIQQMGVDVGGWGLEYLGLHDDGEKGLPAIAGAARTYAKKSYQHEIHSLTLGKSFPQISTPLKKIAFYGMKQHSHITTVDEVGHIQPLHPTSNLGVSSGSFGARVEAQRGIASLTVDSSKTKAEVATEALHLSREHQRIYTGLHLDFFDAAEFLAKINKEILEDNRNDASDSTTRRTVDGFGLALNLRFSQILSTYVQFAKNERAPSLFEEFGDGGSILENTELKGEETTHREIGFSASMARASFLVSYFQDRTNDKIIVLPSALPNAWKAQNLDETILTGYELQSQLQLLDETSVRLSFLFLDPVDKSQGDHDAQIPGLARQYIATEWQQKFDEVTLRLMNRYRSSVYKDTRNTIELDPLWIHDASLDYRYVTRQVTASAGIGLFNITDVTSQGIESKESGARGKTSYSEVNGYPLPGRNWKVYTALVW